MEDNDIDLKDAYGAALMACFRGEENRYVVERDDGYISIGRSDIYFQEYDAWSGLEQEMPSFVHGRVLDVGCGAGRHALYLQSRGHEVVGIDKSPLAVEVAKQRGVQYVLPLSIDDLVANPDPSLGTFDSIVMMGHNIGLLHDFETGKRTLSRLAELTSPNGRIVGTTRDVSSTTKPYHLAYQEGNLRKGRMRGQIRLRIRYEMCVSDWFDYLFVSEQELRQMAHGTGWRLGKTIMGYGGFAGVSYLMVLCKE